MSQFYPLVVEVLLACHNRKLLTLQCLRSLFEIESDDLKFLVHVVDDGSLDGTWDAVSSEFPQVDLIKGSGSLFWAASMALGETHIEDNNRWIMWLNDDVKLELSLKDILPVQLKSNPDSILVGEIYDNSDQFQYGLIYQGRLKDDLFSRNSQEMCGQNPKTFNGNLVLIPSQVRRAVGTIDGKFSHGYADIDYGLRATKRGIALRSLPGISGRVNSRTKYGVDEHRTSYKQLLFSNKGQPIKDQIRFFRRHSKFLWIFYIALPFIRVTKFKIINLIHR